MALYSPGAKRELTKKRARRLASIPNLASITTYVTDSTSDPSHLRTLRTYAVLCAPRTRPD